SRYHFIGRRTVSTGVLDCCRFLSVVSVHGDVGRLVVRQIGLVDSDCLAFFLDSYKTKYYLSV
ncbi:MAG TPA: hypothetical protein PKN24_12985, partial [bacterium]|nr:hypothetical protein [bacterium]